MACGGGGPPTKAGYIERADARCRKGDAALAKVGQAADTVAVADAAALLARTTYDEVVDLRRMPMPVGEQAAITAVINDLDAVGEPARRVDVAARNQKLAAGPAMVEARARAAKVATSAGAYGFHECGPGADRAAAALLTATGPALKPIFVYEASKACTSFSAKVDGLREPTSVTAFGLYAKDLNALLAQLTVELQALPAPPGTEAAFADFIATFNKFVPLINTATAEVRRSGTSAGRATIAAVDALVAQLKAQAEALGFNGC